MSNVPGKDTINDNHLVYQEINTSDANLVYVNNSMNKIQKQKKNAHFIFQNTYSNMHFFFKKDFNAYSKKIGKYDDV